MARAAGHPPDRRPARCRACRDHRRRPRGPEDPVTVFGIATGRPPPTPDRRREGARPGSSSLRPERNLRRWSLDHDGDRERPHPGRMARPQPVRQGPRCPDARARWKALPEGRDCRQGRTDRHGGFRQPQPRPGSRRSTLPRSPPGSALSTTRAATGPGAIGARRPVRLPVEGWPPARPWRRSGILADLPPRRERHGRATLGSPERAPPIILAEILPTGPARPRCGSVRALNRPQAAWRGASRRPRAPLPAGATRWPAPRSAALAGGRRSASPPSR